MKNTNYRFEWGNIFLILTTSLIVANVATYVAFQFIIFSKFVDIRYWSLLPIIIFIVAPLFIGFLVAKKVQMRKIFQAGLCGIFYSIGIGIESLIAAFLFLPQMPSVISSNLEIGRFITNYILFVIPVTYGLSCLGAFIETKTHKLI